MLLVSRWRRALYGPLMVILVNGNAQMGGFPVRASSSRNQCARSRNIAIFSLEEKSSQALEVRIRPLTQYLVFKEQLFATNLDEHCNKAFNKQKQIFACESLPKSPKQATLCLNALRQGHWKQVLEVCRLEIKESMSPNFRVNGPTYQAFSSTGKISLVCADTIIKSSNYYIEGIWPKNAVNCTILDKNKSFQVSGDSGNLVYPVSVKGLMKLLKPQLERLTESLSKRSYIDPSLALRLLDTAYEANTQNENTFYFMLTAALIAIIVIGTTFLAKCLRDHKRGKNCWQITSTENTYWSPDNEETPQGDGHPNNQTELSITNTQ